MAAPVLGSLHIIPDRLEACVAMAKMCYNYRILVPSLDKLDWESVAITKQVRMRWRALQRGKCKGRMSQDFRDPMYREVVRTGEKEKLDKVKVMYRDSAEERRMICRALDSCRSMNVPRPGHAAG